MGEGKGTGLQRDSKRDLCDGGTVLYLECGSSDTNLHVIKSHTHTHRYMKNCDLNKVCEL